MTRFKVLPLNKWMEWSGHGEILEMGYRDVTLYEELFNRDGQYYDRKLKIWWFEVDGRAYTRPGAETQFLYGLSVMGYEILPKRELDGIIAVLNITRCPAVKLALNRRLSQHQYASSLHYTGRRAALTRIRILGK